MKKDLQYAAFILLFLPFGVIARQRDTLFRKLDSLAHLPPPLKRGNQDSIRQEFYNSKTKITFPVYWKLLASDLKQEVTFPFHARPRDWVRTAVVTGITVGVLLTDKPMERKAVEWRNESSGLVETSKYVTRFGGRYEIITLATLGTYGFLFKNEKIRTTTFLATQAYINSTIFESLKFLSGRQRPFYYDPVTHTNAPTWHGPFYQFKRDANGNKPNVYSYTSFPSGHTMAAFAAATVYAMEYSNRKIVPVLAYSVATVVGLSRITENKHWASDVLIGGILGHLIGRQIVNNYHRYAKLKMEQAGKKHNSLSFAPQNLYGRWLPGVVYRFN